jgi:hypothetical protein
MGHEHERPSKNPVAYARAGRKLADPLTSNPQSRTRTTGSYGFELEVLSGIQTELRKNYSHSGAENFEKGLLRSQFQIFSQKME